MNIITDQKATYVAIILNTDKNSPYRGYIKSLKMTSHLGKLTKKEDGAFKKYQVTKLKNQGKLLINYFSVFEQAYAENWHYHTNPFMVAVGFNAALEILCSDLLQVCYAKKDFTKEMFASLLILDKNDLIQRSEVVGMSDKAAKEKIKARLKAFINTQQSYQENDFKF